MKHAFAFMLLSLAASGCATTPVPAASASPAPQERLLAFQTAPPGPAGTLIVTRDKGLGGSGCYYGFFINGILAARLAVAETAAFHVSPGELVLRSGRDPQGRGLCSTLQSEWTQRETTLADGEIKYFRLSIDVNGKTDIQRAEPITP